MTGRTIVISINASWNIYNFRRELIAALAADGHHIVALAPEDDYSPRLAEIGAELVPLPMDKKGVSPINDLLLLARYRSALARIRPALFLGYTIKPNVYGSIAAQSLGIPTINNVSGLGTAFIRQGLLTRIATLLYRRAFRRSFRIFFQNAEDRDLFVREHMVRPDQAALLPGSGIDLDRFRPAAMSEGQPVTFLLIGRLLRDKGVREYVEAARLVRQRHPEVRFRILGFVDAANRTAIGRSELDGWVAEGLVEYLPACEDVRQHIAEADCIVLPSYREGLPRTLLEGAAMARPLIATDVPGCRDVVEDGVTGLLCPVRDGAGLAAAMLRMIDMAPDEREMMGRRGRSKVEREFALDIVIARYREAIAAALADRTASIR